MKEQSNNPQPGGQPYEQGQQPYQASQAFYGQSAQNAKPFDRMTTPPPVGSPYEVIGVWRYVFIFFVLSIPFVNLIVLIVWAVSSPKVNLKNLATGLLIWIAILIVLSFILWILFGTMLVNLSNTMYTAY